MRKKIMLLTSWRWLVNLFLFCIVIMLQWHIEPRWQQELRIHVKKKRCK